MSRQRLKKNFDGSIHGELSVILLYEDDGTITAFCPSLDLTTYGDSLEDVQEAFQEALAIFIEEMEEKDILKEELIRLGWKSVNGAHPTYKQPENVTIPLEILQKSREIIQTPFRIPA